MLKYKQYLKRLNFQKIGTTVQWHTAKCEFNNKVVKIKYRLKLYFLTNEITIIKLFKQSILIRILKKFK